MNECYKMSEKNKQLDKLINCLTPILAIQTCGGYREFPGTDNPTFKNESMKLLKGILSESLKSLGSYFNGLESSYMRKMPITQVPHTADNLHSASDDAKVPEERNIPVYSGDRIMKQSEGPSNLGVKLDSPLSSSDLLSPLDSLSSSDPGMNVDPLPSYFTHEEINSNFNNNTAPSDENMYLEL